MKKPIFRTNLMISVVIIIGFICVQISTDAAFRRLFMPNLEYVSNLTSENMHVGIKEIMGKPINVSLSMAHDVFLRDFMLAEESDTQSEERINKLIDYLTEYKNKNGFDSAFLVSNKTQNYYHYKNGIDRVLSKNEVEDEWYYDFTNSSDEYSLNIDNDQATDDGITVFVNCKLKDEIGNVIGTVGVGMKTTYIQQLLVDNEEKYNIEAFLVDESGIVQLSATLTEFENVNLFTESKYAAMKEKILVNKTSTETEWYQVGQKSGYFITRYIPYLNWYLIVEKSTDALYQIMVKQLFTNLIFIAIVLTAVLSVTTFILKKNNSRIRNLAEQDQLTGLNNRTTYERDIERYEKLDKYNEYGIGIFDLNDLKKVNDKFGHLEGDGYLKIFANILSNAFKDSPIYRIGGDEFCVIISSLDRETILNSCETIQQELEIMSKNKEYQMSVSYGYAFYDEEIAQTPAEVFKAADENMYINKNNYKQR